MTLDSPRVAVIGAGLAGLSCAQALQAASPRLGIDLFDKSRGVSGRMSTRRGEGWQADHGAQGFTAQDPAFAQEVQRWVQAGVAAVWAPRLTVLGGGDQQAAADAAAPGRQALAGPPDRLVGVPRMTSPAQWLADRLTAGGQTTSATLHLNHTVQGLLREGGRWRLLTAEHGPLAPAFDAVLLAVPAPQAAPLLDGVASDWARRAQAVAMRPCWTLMMRFDARVDLPFDAAFVHVGPIGWLARDSAKPGRGPSSAVAETWVLQASAEWSEAHVEDEPEQAAEALLAAFRQWGGPLPQAWSAHRWRYADSPQSRNDAMAWCRPDGIGVCGDWLGGGQVEGAWLSGRDLAAQVLAQVPGLIGR